MLRSSGLKHRCNWPGCEKLVRQSLWGCPVHWFKVPLSLRARLLKAYVPGQSISTATQEYKSAFEDIMSWIRQSFPAAGKSRQAEVGDAQ